jgi:hypothetical protein
VPGTVRFALIDPTPASVAVINEAAVSPPVSEPVPVSVAVISDEAVNVAVTVPAPATLVQGQPQPAEAREGFGVHVHAHGVHARVPRRRDVPEWLWRERYAADGSHALPEVPAQRKFHRVASRPSYSCDTCGHHIHPTAGTIFHKSATSLHLWFYAMYLMTSTRCAVSAKHLERELGVTYKTAWRMANLIRNELMDQDDEPPLSGDVEADETWIGGKPKAQPTRRGRGGSPVARPARGATPAPQDGRVRRRRARRARPRDGRPG